MTREITRALLSTPIAELFTQLADNLQSAARKLARWGVKVPADSRLAQAAVALREFAARGAIMSNQVAVELDIAVAGPLWLQRGSRSSRLKGGRRRRCGSSAMRVTG